MTTVFEFTDTDLESYFNEIDEGPVEIDWNFFDQ